MNSGRFYKEAARLTKLHGAQPSLTQTLANWQWHVSLTSYPAPRTRPSGLEARCFPLSAQLLEGMSPHPLTNARGWLAMERWYHSERRWAEAERWWKALSCGTVRAMLLVSKRHLSPQSTKEGQFCRGVGHRCCSGVTWTAFVPWTLLISPPEGPAEPHRPALCALPGLSRPARCPGKAAGTKAAHMLI